MHVTLLAPEIHDLQTGGNVYNRRIAGALPSDVSVRVVRWDPEQPAIPFETAEDRVIVIDSLLTQHPSALRAVRDAHPSATMILLAHYLHCIDPTAEAPDAAATERLALEMMDGAVTTSGFVRRALVDEGLPGDRVLVVPPGLAPQDRGPLPGQLGQEAPRMLTVANLVPGKGLQSFVEVLSQLRSLSWTWTLVGDSSLDPAYAEGVKRRIRETGISGRVTYTGPVSSETLRTWYSRADLLVVPSRFETRSLATREAMARGLPVVGYDVGGLSENFGHPSAGCLVPPDTPAALCSALRPLLTDPMVRAQKGRAAWRQSQTFPAWSEAAEQFRKGLATIRYHTSEE